MVRAQKTAEIDTGRESDNSVASVALCEEATVGAWLALCTTTRPTPPSPATYNGCPMVPHRSPHRAHARRVESNIVVGESWSPIKARPPPLRLPVRYMRFDRRKPEKELTA